MSASLRPWIHTIILNLGTEQTTVGVPAFDFLQSYPSYVSHRKSSYDVVGVGEAAQGLYEKSQAVVEVSTPIYQGVVAHIDDCALLLSWILSQVRQHFHVHPWLFHPNIVFLCGNSLTSVERKLLLRLGRMMTLRPASILLAGSALRMSSEFELDAVAQHILMIDCGASQTELSIVGPHSVVLSKRLSWGGRDVTAAVQRYIRQEHQLVVGQESAARVKHALLHLMLPDMMEKKTRQSVRSEVVRGRHAVTGLPETTILKQDALMHAIHNEYEQLLDAIRATLEEVSADVAADVIGQGVYMIGAGSLAQGLQQYVSGYLGTQVFVARHPSEVALRGAMAILGKRR